VSLTSRILLAMAAGILVGSLFNFVLHGADLTRGFAGILNTYLVEGLFDVVGRIFVASLKLLVVPLVLVSLICGSSSLGNSSRMGPIAGKTMLFYLATTAIAVSVALIFAVFVGPGEGVNLTSNATFQAGVPPPLTDVLVNIFPTNPVQAMAEGKMLQIIVFALLFGYAISHAGEPGQRIASFFRDMESVVMKMVDILMHLAPYGVFALLAKLFSHHGDQRYLGSGELFFHSTRGAVVPCAGDLYPDPEKPHWPLSAHTAKQNAACVGVRIQYRILRRYSAHYYAYG
jgi:Na+/H+-dicarboxylate symporter